MIKYSFSAYALTREFDLNTIASFFGITGPIKWEKPIILSNEHFKEILDANMAKLLYIYSFGTMVFINFSAGEMTSIIDFFEKNFNILKCVFTINYIDEYILDVDQTSMFLVENDYSVIPENNPDYLSITAIILARSVALEKMEYTLDKGYDEAESLINSLNLGRLQIKNQVLSKLSGKILRFKYESISYIMLFDKPDITWNDPQIDEYYSKLFDLFELKERYEQAKIKQESIISITQYFSKLSHKNKMANLDWIIIILIIIFIFTSIIKIIYG